MSLITSKAELFSHTVTQFCNSLKILSVQFSVLILGNLYVSVTAHALTEENTVVYPGAGEF